MEEVARALQAERRRLTIEYKHITPDDFLEWIFKRNEIKYTQAGKGDKWGATFDGLFNSTNTFLKKRLGRDPSLDEIYESIADGAAKTAGATKQKLGDSFYTFFSQVKNDGKVSNLEFEELEKVLRKYRMRE